VTYIRVYGERVLSIQKQKLEKAKYFRLFMSSLAIMHHEANSSLSAIRTLGFDAALRVAYARAVSTGLLLDEAKRCIKLNRNFVSDARSYQHSPVLFERFLMLARFYRLLGHQLYWEHRKTSESKDMTFLQEI